MKARRIEIGLVRSANPARRELRIRPFAGDIPPDVAWLYVAGAAGVEMRYRVDRIEGDRVILSAGVTRDAVAQLRGATVCADVDMTAADDWQSRLAALEGFAVVDEAGIRLGTVAAVYATEANAAIEVAGPDGGSLMLPAIDRVIVSVDMERGRVAVKDIAPYAVESLNPRTGA